MTTVRAATVEIRRDRASDRTREILRILFGPDPPGVAVRLWDETVWPGAAHDAAAVVTLTHPGALRRMVGYPLDVRMGESYIRGDFEVEGDLDAAFAVGARLQKTIRGPRDLARLLRLVRSLPGDTKASGESEPRQAYLRGAKHTRERDRDAVAHHYDAGNDFFQLWLDRRLVYSCAYFPLGDEDIDTAQEAKLDLICRKLRLRPGERLLDIGCGWGGLVQYAAERYQVTSVGVTLSRAQAEFGTRAIAAAGLGDGCQILLRDYRDLPDGLFDKVTSVGMFEHVGRAHLPQYFAAAWAALRPGGLFLNHGIAGRSGHSRGRPQASFIDKYVFPDGELVPIGEALAFAEQAGFEVRDVESLREHYALTLRHWVRRLEHKRQEAMQAAGAAVYRTWRLFMAASAYGFTTGKINVYQALLAKPDAQGRSSVPLTRADLYTPAPPVPPR